ncbi:MAG: hypothetical protein H6807_11390 [Planctomycetes bacterium]|nr:hypothetical protein [Planctomycetota bacterium]
MKTPLSLLLILCALAAALPAQEALFVGYDPTGATNLSDPIGVQDKAQTFTCPQAGLLTSVSVYVAAGTNPTGVQLHILPTTNGVPEPLANALFSFTLPAGSIPQSPGWVNVDVSSASIMGNTSDVYAIALTCDSGSFTWRGNGNSASYSGGTIYFTNAAAGFPNWLQSLGDLGFAVYTESTAGIVVNDNTEYFQDFDGLAYTGFKVVGGVWERGTPAQNFISQAASGSTCWMTDLDADYPLNNLCSLVSPVFDLGQLAFDPVLSFQVTWNTQSWDDGLRVEMDLGDGQGWRTLGDSSFYNSAESFNSAGGLDGIFWGGNTSSSWHEERVNLAGAAGQGSVRLRFLFGSDIALAKNGAAIDDIRISVPNIVVDSTNPYCEGFEGHADGWTSEFTSLSSFSTVGAPIWEVGSPVGPAVPPWSGSRCVATDLDSNYPIACVGTFTSPSCDFSSLANDPMLELALWHDLNMTSGADGVRVEVDLNDGNGFQALGSTADWYDGVLSGNNTVGGVCWTGQSNGWRFPQHRITGAAGKTGVRIRFLLGSNTSVVGVGALIDDVRIYESTFAGSESLAGDDLRMQIDIDGERVDGLGDIGAMSPGQQIDVLTLSSEGDLIGGEYYLVCEVFATGATYTNVAPDVWISLTGSSILLDGGVQGPFYVPRQLGPFGEAHSYYYGGGAAGYSCRVQALVFLPSAANGLYASSDAFELKFN